jgi:hypothetical protein
MHRSSSFRLKEHQKRFLEPLKSWSTLRVSMLSLCGIKYQHISSGPGSEKVWNSLTKANNLLILKFIFSSENEEGIIGHFQGIFNLHHFTTLYSKFLLQNSGNKVQKHCTTMRGNGMCQH